MFLGKPSRSSTSDSMKNRKNRRVEYKERDSKQLYERYSHISDLFVVSLCWWLVQNALLWGLLDHRQKFAQRSL